MGLLLNWVLGEGERSRRSNKPTAPERIKLSYFELNFRGSDLRWVISVGWHNEGIQLIRL
jgi:hypothetical protein